jgi:hypothetical protein
MTTKISISQITAPASNVSQSLVLEANGTVITAGILPPLPRAAAMTVSLIFGG